MPWPEPAAPQHVVRIANGSLYLPAQLCELYLPGIDAIALLLREGAVFLLPLHGASAGGMLLKLRTARGDRVVHAAEFLRELGIDADAPEILCPVRWVTEIGGLSLQSLPLSGVPESQ